jgi:hypothetical protein
MQLPSRRFFITGVVASLGVTALLGIISIITSGLGDIGTKILISTGEVDFAAVLALGCAGNTSTKLHKRIQTLGLLSIFTGLVLGIYLTWTFKLFESQDDIVLKTFGVMFVLAISSAHACQILPLMVYNRILDRLVRGTVVCIAIVAGLVINAIVFPEISTGETYYKFVGIVLILDVFGTILIPVLRRFGPPRTGQPDTATGRYFNGPVDDTLGLNNTPDQIIAPAAVSTPMSPNVQDNPPKSQTDHPSED